jgi:hypothetical protein
MPEPLNFRASNIDLSGLFKPVDLSALFQPVDLSGLFQPIDLGGLFKPVDLSGLFKPIDLSGMIKPVDLSGLFKPLDLSSVLGDGSGDSVVRIATDSHRRGAHVATLYTNQSIPTVLLEPPGATPDDRVPEVEPTARVETDWFESTLFLLPKRWREEGLGDLLEDRASWKAGGTSRLRVEIFTVSQLILSALDLVWSAAKVLIPEIVRRYLGL